MIKEWAGTKLVQLRILLVQHGQHNVRVPWTTSFRQQKLSNRYVGFCFSVEAIKAVKDSAEMPYECQVVTGDARISLSETAICRVPWCPARPSLKDDLAAPNQMTIWVSKDR